MLACVLRGDARPRGDARGWLHVEVGAVPCPRALRQQHWCSQPCPLCPHPSPRQFSAQVLGAGKATGTV